MKGFEGVELDDAAETVSLLELAGTLFLLLHGLRREVVLLDLLSRQDDVMHL